MKTLVELEGVNGDWFDLTRGDRGVYLARDVKGMFYDPPVKVMYEEPGNYPGARYLNHRILRRDIVFAVEILNDARSGENSWLYRDSDFRKALAYDRDATLYVTTEDSGRRYLKIRLSEAPETEMLTDPNDRVINRTTFVCVAYDPFWYEDDFVVQATTATDTRFDPSFWTPPWPWQELPKETLVFDVQPSSLNGGGLNPTDQHIWPKWVVPGADLPPAGLIDVFDINFPWETAPFAQYDIPDPSFEDPEFADRVLRTPGLVYGENCLVDSDPRVEQFTAESGSQVWARTNGVRFRHPIPPYTRAHTYEVKVTGLPPGKVVSLRLPRPWSRAWGLH